MVSRLFQIQYDNIQMKLINKIILAGVFTMLIIGTALIVSGELRIFDEGGVRVFSIDIEISQTAANNLMASGCVESVIVGGGSTITRIVNDGSECSGNIQAILEGWQDNYNLNKLRASNGVPIEYKKFCIRDEATGQVYRLRLANGVSTWISDPGCS